MGKKDLDFGSKCNTISIRKASESNRIAVLAARPRDVRSGKYASMRYAFQIRAAGVFGRLRYGCTSLARAQVTSLGFLEMPTMNGRRSK